MRIVTKDWLENGDDHNFYLIGDKDREALYPAIIGLARDMSHVIYSYQKLVECFMTKEGWDCDEAMEWIDYNVATALLYYGTGAPKILDVAYIQSKNKTYEPIKVE